MYFYLGGQQLGEFVVNNAENTLTDIEKKMEYRIEKKIEILVFNDFNDVYQTNLGIQNEDFNTGGKTKIFGNKLFIYFNGDHSDLLNQLREGIVMIFLNDMIYGGDIQDVVQNAVLHNAK